MIVGLKNYRVFEKPFKMATLHERLTEGDILITKDSLESNISVGENAKINDLKIHASGENNSITFGSNILLNNCGIYIEGNNNKIEIGDDSKLQGTFLMCRGNNNKIILGKGVSISGEFWGYVHIHTMEETSIIIGEDCMLSGNIIIRTTDGHAIIDENLNRLNIPKNIEIGKHVWLGTNVMVLKGAVIPNNTIVGANSVVTKPFIGEENKTLYLGGNPAKVLKSDNSYWVRKRGYDFLPDDYKLK